VHKQNDEDQNRTYKIFQSHRHLTKQLVDVKKKPTQEITKTPKYSRLYPAPKNNAEMELHTMTNLAAAKTKTYGGLFPGLEPATKELEPEQHKTQRRDTSSWYNKLRNCDRAR
jgi:hypothetical protein